MLAGSKLLTTLQSFSRDPGFAEYAKFDIKRFSALWSSAGEAFWQKIGEKKALALFHMAAERVPAYRDFLKRERIKHASVKTIQDFRNVTPTTKENYVTRYPLADRMLDGNLDAARLIAVSSGTTGDPNFWPRGAYQEFEAAVIHELLYRTLYGIDRKRTLLLIGFPMGIYVSGLATLVPSWMTAARGYPLTVIGVGNNKVELTRALDRLGAEYEQVIIAGHPFFIKETLELVHAQRIQLPKAIKTFMCSEGFSEAWRNHLSDLAGGSLTTDLLSTYGSSELLLMAYETPLSIRVRDNKKFETAFTTRLTPPSLFQYNPFFRHIESLHGELLFTARMGTPFIRFNMHDSGEVVSYADMQKATGFSDTARDWKLPFLTLHGRSDNTIIFYAANIYSEHIKAGLDHPAFLNVLTGRFVMRKKYTKTMDQVLEINIELQPQRASSKRLAKQIQKHVTATLLRLSSEFSDTSKHAARDITPRVLLRPYQDKQHFPVGAKPKYIIT